MSTILGYDRTLDTSTTLMCISTYKSNVCYPSWSPYILFYGLWYRHTIIVLMLNNSFFLLLQSLICHGTNGYFYLRLLSLAFLGWLDITIFSTAPSSYPINSWLIGSISLVIFFPYLPDRSTLVMNEVFLLLRSNEVTWNMLYLLIILNPTSVYFYYYQEPTPTTINFICVNLLYLTGHFHYMGVWCLQFPWNTVSAKYGILYLLKMFYCKFCMWGESPFNPLYVALLTSS